MINIPNSNIPKINSSNPYMQLLNQTNIVKDDVYIKDDNNMKDENTNLLKEINDKLCKLLEKKIKNKKNTYLNITRAMFDKDILYEYPDFPLDKINMIYSDGVNYFIKIGNKKYPLNRKYFLKFINCILK